ncbi:MAG: hypothetical protein MJ078_04035, partial [Clostridia bacterium]|nr:hypothetical protein [Clostridia bacterium]
PVSAFEDDASRDYYFRELTESVKWLANHPSFVMMTFGNELAAGKIILRAVNVELKENAHFVDDFKLTTKSVVLAKSSRFRNLGEIWTRIRQGDNAYKSYIAESIRDFMKERK